MSTVTKKICDKCGEESHFHLEIPDSNIFMVKLWTEENSHGGRFHASGWDGMNRDFCKPCYEGLLKVCNEYLNND